MYEDLSLAQARALLEWQVELGATEAIGDEPIDRFELASVQAAPVSDPASPVAASPGPVAPEPAAGAQDAVAAARQAAGAAGTIEALRVAMESYEHCDLRQGARNLVFSDGQPGARVMIVGEAPGRDEDIAGRPFVGRAGQLLDRMFAAIGLGRGEGGGLAPLYITNVMPWRPPQNRDPRPEEIAMMVPFLERHIELAAPDFLISMGNTSCQAILGRKGITRLRGNWAEAMGRPVLPMFHPAYLLRNPVMKREAWSDLLSLRARLSQDG